MLSTNINTAQALYGKVSYSNRGISIIQQKDETLFWSEYADFDAPSSTLPPPVGPHLNGVMIPACTSYIFGFKTPYFLFYTAYTGTVSVFSVLSRCPPLYKRLRISSTISPRRCSWTLVGACFLFVFSTHLVLENGVSAGCFPRLSFFVWFIQVC